MGSHVLLVMLPTTASMESVMPRLIPNFSMELTTVSHSAPALVLTQSPKDLLLMLMDTTDTDTMASVKLKLMPKFCMPDTHMPLPMELSHMPLPLLEPVLSTLPMLVSASTTLELPFLAKHFHLLSRAFNEHQISKSNMMLPKLVQIKIRTFLS